MLQIKKDLLYYNKVDLGCKIDVDFKPFKKMKKRRELDALVNNKLGRKKKKGEHELLRNESDSSEIDEFSIPHKSVIRHRPGRLCSECSTCMTVCSFFILTACVVGIIGLTWFHLKLKKDSDQLRKQIEMIKLEANSGSVTNDDQQKQLQSDILHIHELQKQHEAINKIQNDTIAVLRKELEVLKRTQATSGNKDGELSADTVQEIRQEIASVGSGMKDTEDKLSTLEDRVNKLEGNSDSGKKRVGTDSANPLDTVGNVIATLNQRMDKLNSSMQTHLSVYDAQIKSHMVSIERLENKTDSMKSSLELLEAGQASSGKKPNMTADIKTALQSLMKGMDNNKNVPAAPDPALLAEVDNMTNSIHQIQQQIQEISDRKGDMKDHVTKDMIDEYVTEFTTFKTSHAQDTKSLNTSISRLTTTVGNIQTTVGAQGKHLNLIQQQIQTGAQTPWVAPPGSMKTPSSTPGIIGGTVSSKLIQSFNDLQNMYTRIDKDGDNKIRYDEMGDFFGPNLPKKEALDAFDTDRDGYYSLEELMSAFGFQLVTPKPDDTAHPTAEGENRNPGDRGGAGNPDTHSENQGGNHHDLTDGLSDNEHSGQTEQGSNEERGPTDDTTTPDSTESQ